MTAKNKPIGVFDSGLGGLTVVKAIMDILPNEEIIYIGDTARVPYGNKSTDTIQRFTTECVSFLERQDVKMVVVACNSASSSNIEAIYDKFDFPIVEVILPGSAAAVKSTKSKSVGVIGTVKTISSGAYEIAIKSMDKNINIFSKSCPLFVPLVEEGWADKDITKLIIKEYLNDYENGKIDTLVLGCTHYPLLKSAISSVLGDGVKLVDSAEETSFAVERILTKNDMKRDLNEPPNHRFYVTDGPDKFSEIGARFLDKGLDNIEQVTVDCY